MNVQPPQQQQFQPQANGRNTTPSSLSALQLFVASRLPSSVFYGWIVLGGIFCSYVVSSMSVTTFPLINVQIKQQFGWTHEQTTLPPQLMYWWIAFAAPAAGWLLGRFQPRWFFMIGILLLTAALGLYSVVESVWMLSVVYILAGTGTTLTGVVTGVYLLSRWFERKRGIAIGIFLVGSSCGGVIFPQIASYCIRYAGWQTTVLVLAGCAFVIGFLPLLLVRNSPEEIGLLPDGAAAQAAPDEQKDTQQKDTQADRHSERQEDKGQSMPEDALIAAPSRSVSFRTIAHTPSFYLVLYITASVWFCLTALTQHIALYFKDLNLDVQMSANILSLLLACSVIGKALFGWLSDRFDKKNILLLASLSMLAGSTLMRLVAEYTDLLLIPAAVVYGIGFSGCFTMIQLLVAEHYSLSPAYGNVLGVVTMLDTIAGALGIRVLAVLRTSSGDYSSGFLVLIASGVLMVLCVVILRRPNSAQRDYRALRTVAAELRADAANEQASTHQRGVV
jgi:sugar phosphate permease